MIDSSEIAIPTCTTIPSRSRLFETLLDTEIEARLETI
jgi:hypothetical protein